MRAELPCRSRDIDCFGVSLSLSATVKEFPKSKLEDLGMDYLAFSVQKMVCCAASNAIRTASAATEAKLAT